MTQPPVPPAAGPPWPNNSAPLPPTRPPRPKRTPWIILGGALVVVIALVVGIVLWKSGSSGNAGDSSNIAGGGGDRTVGLLREEDPVCADWLKYADELAAETAQWAEIDETIPAAKWSKEEREIYSTASEAFLAAADRFEYILPQAAHTALQELIAQTIVYWRAYVDALPNYETQDGKYAGVASNFGAAVSFMCTAAPIVALRVADVDVSPEAKASEPAELKPIMTVEDAACREFLALVDRQNAVLSGWEATDPNVPAAKWTLEQRQLNMAAADVMAGDADEARRIADSAQNLVLADLLRTYAAYVDAYVGVVPTYEADDNQIWRVATYLGGGIRSACGAQL